MSLQPPHKFIPKMVVELTSSDTALFQELSLSIPMEHLEFSDLAWHQLNDRPCDIRVKLHFYCTKLLVAARSREITTTYAQIFPLSQSLNAGPWNHKLRCWYKTHQINYRWGFPFAIYFAYQDKQYYSATPLDMQILFKVLQLATVDPSSEILQLRTPSHSSLQPYTTIPVSEHKETQLRQSHQCSQILTSVPTRWEHLCSLNMLPFSRVYVLMKPSVYWLSSKLLPPMEPFVLKVLPGLFMIIISHSMHRFVFLG